MLFESEHNFFEKVLFDGLGHPYKIKKVQHVSGGDINHACKVATTNGVFFVKWNQFPQSDMFSKEAQGLNLLRSAACIDVPQTLGYGKVEGKNYLILEEIEKGRHSLHFWEDFGQKLAKLHQHSSSKHGLNHDNYIGRLPQQNSPKADWITFFIEQRLSPQLSMGRNKGIISRTLVQQFESLYKLLPDLIPEEPPALLHGDLWSGNFMCGTNHRVWLIDPAVYYGHREMELAFTRLFGGYDERFYKSYQEVFPLALGFDNRVNIHNIYPLLVHVNLFGTSYLRAIEGTIKRLV